MTADAATFGCRYEMTMDYEASKIIYRNVKGVAELACASSEHRLAGTVEFKHCH
jgi:hypothetical protein